MVQSHFGTLVSALSKRKIKLKIKPNLTTKNLPLSRLFLIQHIPNQDENDTRDTHHENIRDNYTFVKSYLDTLFWDVLRHTAL